jgi:thiamine pyrophosphate-dependent acetolactate synthase large subunit-like protein
MLAGLREHGIGMAGWRSDALRDRIASEVADPAPFTVPAGRLDPREVMTKIDAVVPKDWDIVCGLGHFFFFAMTGLGGRRPERYHVISEFGAIGSALAAAIGIAAARRDGRVLLIDGDAA